MAWLFFRSQSIIGAMNPDFGLANLFQQQEYAVAERHG
jgi:hypothetical protein